MRQITRINFATPPVHATSLVARADLPQGMVVLNCLQHRGSIVLFADAPVKPILVPTVIMFVTTAQSPVPHPACYVGSVIMVDSQKEWHVYLAQGEDEKAFLANDSAKEQVDLKSPIIQ